MATASASSHHPPPRSHTMSPTGALYVPVDVTPASLNEMLSTNGQPRPLQSGTLALMIGLPLLGVFAYWSGAANMQGPPSIHLHEPWHAKVKAMDYGIYADRLTSGPRTQVPTREVAKQTFMQAGTKTPMVPVTTIGIYSEKQGKRDEGSMHMAAQLPKPSIGACPADMPVTYSGSVNKAGHTIYYTGVEYRYFWKGYSIWESGTFQVFRRFAPRQVVLDIGGWIGPTALWEGQVAKSVVVLEPTQKAFSELCANIAANRFTADKVVAIHAAMDAKDGTVQISNRGDSMDRLPRILQTVNVRAISIDTLLREQPVLEGTGFVKIDTEGYERVIVPALEAFFVVKRPVVYVSLHQMHISHAEVQKVVDKLKAIFPYMYEQDMETPFNSAQSSYLGGDHGGTDVLCTWEPLTDALQLRPTLPLHASAEAPQMPMLPPRTAAPLRTTPRSSPRPVTQAVPAALPLAMSTKPIFAQQVPSKYSRGACPASGKLHSSHKVSKTGQTVYYTGHAFNWFWSIYSTWESGTFNVFKRFVPGRIVLDIGGWIGPTALWEAQVAQAVVVLEPTQVAFDELCRNIAASGAGVSKRVVAIHAAMDAKDGTVRISNRGDSEDRILQAIDVRAVSIDTLRKEQPILEGTAFVKIDTEGYERVIVPALQDFFVDKRPNAYVSLHPMFISHAQVQSVVDKLKAIFPYLYEQDMQTPFNSGRDSYRGGDHGGTDVVCTWKPLHL